MPPIVYIVLLNWNSGEDTIECIKSLQKIAYPHYEIVVVDNNSWDNSVKKIENEFPKITLIENDENLGFSRGNNKGIKYALERGSDYILILNNDTIVSEDFLTPLVRVGEKFDDSGIITGKIMSYFRENEIWCAGGEIDWIRGMGKYFGHKGGASGEKDKDQYDSLRKVSLASGCLMLIKRELIEEVGFFPEEYFFGGEEWDYSAKVVKSKFNIYYTPKSKIWHKVSKSFDQKFEAPWKLYHGHLQKLIFSSNHQSPLLLTLVLFIQIFCYGFLSSVINSRKSKIYKLKLEAIRDFLIESRKITKTKLGNIQEKYGGNNIFK